MIESALSFVLSTIVGLFICVVFAACVAAGIALVSIPLRALIDFLQALTEKKGGMARFAAIVLVLIVLLLLVSGAAMIYGLSATLLFLRGILLLFVFVVLMACVAGGGGLVLTLLDDFLRAFVKKHSSVAQSAGIVMESTTLLFWAIAIIVWMVTDEEGWISAAIIMAGVGLGLGLLSGRMSMFMEEERIVEVDNTGCEACGGSGKSSHTDNYGHFMWGEPGYENYLDCPVCGGSGGG